MEQTNTKKLNFFIQLASQDLQAALIIYTSEKELAYARELAAEKNISFQEITQENIAELLIYARKVTNGDLYAGDCPKKFFSISEEAFQALKDDRKDEMLVSFSPIYQS